MMCMLSVQMVAHASFAEWSEMLFGFLEKADVDRSYVRKSDLPIVVALSPSFIYSKYSARTQSERFRFSLENTCKIGLSAGYRGLSLGFSSQLSNKEGEKPSTDFSLYGFGERFGGGFSFQRERLFRFRQVGRRGNFKTGNIAVRTFDASGYYVFRFRQFSLPAAMTQSFRQVRSAGSPIATLAYMQNSISIDTLALAEQTGIDALSDNLFSRLSHRSVAVGFGYAYNYVLHDDWLLHASFVPSATLFTRSRIYISDHITRQGKHMSINGLLRGAAVWNATRAYCGFSVETRFRHLGYSPFSTHNTYTNLRLFCGFRF